MQNRTKENQAITGLFLGTTGMSEPGSCHLKFQNHIMHGVEQAIVFVISMGSPFNILFRPLGNCLIIDERKPKRDRKLENK